MATKNTLRGKAEWLDKKASSHTDVSRALISTADRFPAKYNFAGRETAAPIGALFITESPQRPVCVFCGNWIVGLIPFLWLKAAKGVDPRYVNKTIA
jgi:hypothetical protein